MLLLKKLKEYIKTREIIVLLILLSLPFTHIPEFLQKTGIIVGGYFKMKLLMYPIFSLVKFVSNCMNGYQKDQSLLKALNEMKYYFLSVK